MTSSPEHPPYPRSQLWLVRHGETEWSASGRHTSTTDLDLTDAGAEGARAVAAKLAGTSFARVLTSPLLRARRTAELAGFPDAEVVDGPHGVGLRRRRGPHHARDPRAAARLDGVARRSARGRDAAPTSAPAPTGVVSLVRSVDASVLAFAHGHFCRVLGARWLGLDVEDGAHLALSTASVSVLGWERDDPAVLHWNHTGTLT